jgi:leader peptidase (prepilin peptidase)/N-methyltransferase
LSWWHNIPVLAYIMNRGRCGQCRAPIGIAALAYELLTASLFFAVAVHFGPSWQALAMAVFCLALVISTFVDLEFRIIPDQVSLGFIPAGVFFSAMQGGIGLGQSVLGVLLGGGSLWLIAWTYKKMTGQDGMGMGDIKLLALFGAFLGPMGAVMSLMLGSVVGACFGLFAMLLRGARLKTAFPFGPFLALGALAVVFWGQDLSPFFFGGFYALSHF